VTEAEMPAFLALTLQMGHTVQDRLEDYWTKMEQLCTPFYGQTIPGLEWLPGTSAGGG